MAGRTGLTDSERQARQEKRLARMQKREKMAMNGTMFKYQVPHDYPSPNAFKRQINAYFALREADKKPQTIPGLALFLGFTTDVLSGYEPGLAQYDAYKGLVEYALQRIESYTADHFFTSTRPTKGVEFLMQNTHGWANKSSVNNKISGELTQRQKLERMSDEELKKEAERLAPNLQLILGGKR